ncbi:hypothetical protein AGMMS49992_12080 [Clostridia bacterium]|nr:hypothetical protein AGMMS49992_12080 [Clostridia bacterium]
MRKIKSILFAALLVVAMLTMSGCYFRTQVQESTVALHMVDGASVEKVLPPGMYTDMGLAATLRAVSTTSIPINWHDESVLTADEQRVSFTIDLAVKRKSDEASVMRMWREYNNEAREDAALTAFVMARIGPAVKAVTTAMTLDQMLGLGNEGGRDNMGEKIAAWLRPKLDECGITLTYLGVTDIDPSPSYLALREQKANAQMEGEVAQQRTGQIQEKLKQEQAQTAINLELARRDNLVAQEKSKVYENDRAFELERLRLLSGVVGVNSKFYFIPNDADLTLYLTGAGGIPAISNTSEKLDSY